MNEFIYGKEEMDYLCQKDGKMKEVIEALGMIHREVDDDLFTSVIHHIVGHLSFTVRHNETISFSA